MKKICLIILLAMSFVTQAQDNFAYSKQRFTRQTDTLPYRLLLPANFNPKKKYPVILFLHGAGERGNNNEAQLIHGSKLFTDSTNRAKYPAIVIFPQCPYTDFWARIGRMIPMTDSTPNVFEYAIDGPAGRSLQLVSELVDSFANTKSVDPKRIYLGGLSMGGMGTFELLWRKPNFFAAAFPICGGGNVTKATVYGSEFPIWIFHGAKDPVVGVNDSRKMAAALTTAGAKVKYTEYPEVKHDSWKNAFAEPDLLPWLFNQHRK